MKSLLNTFLVAVCLMSAVAIATGQQPARDQAKGPLRVHPTNPRYFTDGKKNPDGSLRAAYLTGSHVWNNQLDIGDDDPPNAFDFDAYLDFLVPHNHNFIRLWVWDSATWANGQGRVRYASPQPWLRTGPGLALDGKPKFDLEKFDPAYFERLRVRVQAAGQRGIYVSVMLFEGWELSFATWGGHPFNKANNVQGIDGDPNGDGKGLEIQTLTRPKITAAQEAYVRKVIDTVNDLDNVLYEISNESRLLDPASSTKDWQYHLIRFIKNYETKKPKQHPVGMTSQGFGGGDDSEILLNSPADWISPNPDKSDYKNNPPASDGKKVILLDTDHLWGIGGDAAWVWKSFLRGHNPIFMDSYDNSVAGEGRPDQWEEGVRRAMGQTRVYADKLNLAAMTPQNDLASTKYCLADPGRAYLVYLPSGGSVTVDLSAAAGELKSEWLHPVEGKITPGAAVSGGAKRTLNAPFPGHAVLYLRREGAATPELGIKDAQFTEAQSTLRSQADPCGFLVGCAAWESGSKGHEPAYTATLAREFNLVATRAQLCTGVAQPHRGNYQFGEADQVFEFARQHKMKVWGHCLLSTQDNPATLPPWIKNGGFSREELLAIMREHLHAVIGRYRGRAVAWSVVNEPIKTDAFWRKNVGVDWIEQALRFAHEADPQACLLINEFGIERGPKDGDKWKQFYALVKSLKAKGVPLHAVGFQSYFDGSTNLADVADAMKLFADIGIQVHVTELAVLVGTDAPTPEQLQQQAAVYRSVLQTCLAAPNCKVMTIFGVTDKLHWLVRNGRRESPLLFDGQYRPKPAYHALLDELDRAAEAKGVRNR